MPELARETFGQGFEVRLYEWPQPGQAPPYREWTVKLGWARAVVVQTETQAEALTKLRAFIDEAESAYAALERMEPTDGR